MLEVRDKVSVLLTSNNKQKKIKNKRCDEEKPRITSGLAKLGGKVLAQTSVCRLTVSDNPDGVQSNPNFAKPQGRCFRQF